MGHSSIAIAFRIVMAGALSVVGLSSASAQPGGQQQQDHQTWQRGPVYQRKGSNWNQHGGHRDFRKQDRRFFQQQFPNVQSGQFTRPYPYHLDFYKMKYGGSYAPYFGNLYGPPQVVTAPPYFGPYYGGWGQGAGGFENGAPNGYNGMPMEQPGLPPEGTIIEGPVETATPNNQPSGSLNGEILPVPNP